MNTPHDPAAASAVPRRRRRRLLIGLPLALLLALAAAGTWLLGTQSGLSFALARARAFTQGALQVQKAQGRLLGPLQLEGVHWRGQDGLQVAIASARIDYAPWQLLHKRVVVRSAQIRGLRVELAPPQPSSGKPPDLHAPIDLVLGPVTLRDAVIRRAGQTVFSIDRLQLRDAAWTRSQLVVDGLALDSPQLALAASARVGLDGGWPGQLTAQVQLPRAPKPLAVHVDARSDGRHATLDARMQSPAPATLDARMATRTPYAWQGTLKLPRTALAAFGIDGGHTLAADLQARGDAQQATLQGALDADGWPLRIGSLVLQHQGSTLQLRQLAASSPRIPGNFIAHGSLQPEARPLAADLTLQWVGVKLPPALAGQALGSSGQLQFKGSMQGYTLQALSTLQAEAGRSANVVLQAQGDGQRLDIAQLRLQEQPHGSLDAKGDVTLTAPFAWHLAATATRFDPSLLVPAWPGDLDFALGSSGQIGRQGPAGTLVLHALHGRLRGHSLHGEASLRVQPQQLPQGTLALASGANTLRYRGDASAASADLQVAQLSDFLPQAQGSLAGTVQAHGRWPNLDVDTRLDAHELRYGSMQIDDAHLRASLHDLDQPQGQIQLLANGLQSGTQKLGDASLHFDGNLHHAALQAEVKAPQAQAQLAIEAGSAHPGQWNGRITLLRLAPQGQAAWSLQAPAAWSLQAGTFTLADACLHADAARLCIGGSRAADGSGSMDYRLDALPLAALSALAPMPQGTQVRGTLQGQGALRFDAAGHVQGKANLASENGSLVVAGYADQPLSWRDLAMNADLGASSGQFTAAATLLPQGRFEGNATLSGTQQVLAGHLSLDLPQLAMLEPFVPQLAHLTGSLQGTFDLGGTLHAPQATGHASLQGFGAEVPALGLRLQEGTFAFSRTSDGKLAVKGSVQSGSGTMNLVGEGDAQNFALSLKGKDVLAADLPAAHVRVSPDMHFTRADGGYRLDGTVVIPKAQVDLARLPGAGAAQPSPDVVIVNAPEQAAAAPLPLNANVLVQLGDDVKLRGFGLDGTLAGQLRVEERPGHAPTGRGEIRVGGTYRAYGQDLTIKQGRLLFAGTPLDNPGLDITAVRVLSEVTPGLRVTGTAQRPVLEVFSTPAMQQSEALSYLITGKPLSSLKSGQGDMLNSAAQALGSAGGDLLAKEVGARLGVDAGVSDNADLGGAALTVGKYLSPKLYVGYGVGLFTPGQIVTLRYKLSRLFDLEAQSSALFNRFALKYRVEK